MALYPDGDKLDDFPSRYVLANLAARRAKQIREGAPILVETSSTHPLTIALEEIADGAVKPGVVETEIVTAPSETLESIDLLSREAGALDTGLGEFESLLGTETPEGGQSVTEFASLEESLIDEPATEFEEETISLDDLLSQEEAAFADEDVEAGVAEPEVEELEPEEAVEEEVE